MTATQTPFLTAEWRRLVFLNYRVEPDALRPYLPAHTELDMWNGICYASIVGFRFLNTRVKGWRIPFHEHFTEINLRFYVRRHDPQSERGRTSELGWKRGVVFVREIVPKPAIAIVANSLYQERYLARPMRYIWHEMDAQLEVEYAWEQANRWQTFGVKVENAPVDLKAGSEAEFITEHYWGYARRDDQSTVEYQVEHPRWQMYPVREWRCDIDFGAVYGSVFAHLSDAQPLSVFLAEGSEVSVMGRRIIQ